eukprot:scaffold115975_cov33-Phaeocystis_antarctica.AAC.1
MLRVGVRVGVRARARLGRLPGAVGLERALGLGQSPQAFLRVDPGVGVGVALPRHPVLPPPLLLPHAHDAIDHLGAGVHLRRRILLAAPR